MPLPPGRGHGGLRDDEWWDDFHAQMDDARSVLADAANELLRAERAGLIQAIEALGGEVPAKYR
jgi:hypothetical protein